LFACNAAEGWSRDVSADIAAELRRGCDFAGVQRAVIAARLRQPTRSLIGLLRGMNVKLAMKAFNRAGAEILAVVDSETSRRVIGLLTESYARRRYDVETRLPVFPYQRTLSDRPSWSVPNPEVTQRKSNATIRPENDWLVS
jgi:hypothetical protein